MPLTRDEARDLLKNKVMDALRESPEFTFVDEIDNTSLSFAVYDDNDEEVYGYVNLELG